MKTYVIKVKDAIRPEFEVKDPDKSLMLVMKLDEIGKAPYYAEFYLCEYVLSGGIKAREGWHVQPKEICRWEKEPYRSEYLSEKDLEAIIKRDQYQVEMI